MEKTPDLIAEWEEYHDISWTSNRIRERGCGNVNNFYDGGYVF